MRMGYLFSILLLVFSSSLPAREVAGIEVAERVQAGGATLNLNGAGIRWKFVFKIYVGALYLVDKADSPEAVYSLAGPKRIDMHILYDEISRDKLVDGWNDGFEGNLNADELSAMQSRIASFNNSFTDVKAGDVIAWRCCPVRGPGSQFAGNSGR